MPHDRFLRTVLILFIVVPLFWVTGLASSRADRYELKEVLIEYIHGGLHDGATEDDWDVAGDMAEATTGNRADGVAIKVNRDRFLGIPLWGCLNKRQILEGQLEELEQVADGGTVIKGGYSSGGGAVLDFPMRRHMVDMS